MRKLLGALIIVFLWTAVASATTRYIQLSASGGCSHGNTNYIPASNSCSGAAGSGATVYVASSQNNLHTAIAATNAGDRLEFRAGTYNLKINTNNVAMKSGSSYTNAPTFAAYSGETVTLTSPDTAEVIAIASSPLSPNLAYVIFDGLNVDGSNVTNGGSNIAVGYGSPSAHHIRFTNFRSYNNGVLHPSADRGAGVITFGSDNEIINCRLDHNGGTTAGGSNAPYGVYAKGIRTKIENCEIDNNGVYGIHGYSEPEPNTDHVYSRNRIHDNGYGVGGAGILLASGSGSIAANNLVYHNNKGILVNYGENGGVVYNNTVYDNLTGGIETNATTGVSATIIKNNIASTNGSFQILDGGGSTTFQTNLCSSAGTGCASFGATTSESASTTFIDAAGANFILKAGSVAIDGGTSTIAPGIIIVACSGGITTGCYNGTAPDVGALEGAGLTVAGPPVLTATPSTVSANAPISVNVDDDDVNERTETIGDWVAMFVPGASGSTPAIDWFYMNGTKTAPVAPISDAVISFIAPATPGNYEFRFYADNSVLDSDRLAVIPFAVTTPGIVLKVSANTLKFGPGVSWKIGVP